MSPQKPGNASGLGVAALRPARLEAAVDVPAEVVEGRRDDGDREDVLHRRRHDVLAPRDAGLVGHEADVDQPHEHDGQEVELLGQDLRVERRPASRAPRPSALCASSDNERRDHPRPSSGRTRLNAGANLRDRARRVPCAGRRPCPRERSMSRLRYTALTAQAPASRRPRPSSRRRATTRRRGSADRPSVLSVVERDRPERPRVGCPAGGTASGSSSGSKSISSCAIATASSWLIFVLLLEPQLFATTKRDEQHDHEHDDAEDPPVAEVAPGGLGAQPFALVRR